MMLSRRVKRAWEMSHHRQTTPSPLLRLPLEVRLQIWEHAIGGWTIAIYREPGPDRRRGRLTHGILDESNTSTPGHLFQMDEMEVKETVNQVYNLTGIETLREYDASESGWDPNSNGSFDMNTDLMRPHTMSKRELSALLKTCRSVYQETVGLLYSCNFFVFLHNNALRDLHAMARWESFARIRHLHLHSTLLRSTFYTDAEVIRNGIGQIRNFVQESGDLLVRMPHVQSLSIFLSGNLVLGEACMRLTECLIRISKEARPQFFMVRVPHPGYEGLGQPRGLVPEVYFDPDLLFLKSNALFQSCKAPTDNPTRTSPLDAHDWYYGSEFGWMIGSWYSVDGAEQNEENERSFAITDYAVFTKDWRRELKREFTKRQLKKPFQKVNRVWYHWYVEVRWRLHRMGIFQNSIYEP